MRKLKLDELNRPGLEEYKAIQKKPVSIVLDNIRSLHNVGSAFRTADAFLAEKLWLCGITGTPPNREIHKTALGATDSVDWEYSDNAEAVLIKMKEVGYKIICVEQAENTVHLQEFQPRPGERYCIVFGNEVFGVEDKLMQHADILLEIPQFGTKHSLNVSVSIGIVLWDFFVKTLK